MDRDTASDAELVEASRRGERAAFGELVERYQRVVCAVGYSGTSDLSLGEDIAQDTFVAAYHQLDQLRDVSRVREWLCGIARNLARKARRIRQRETPIDDETADVAEAPLDRANELERDKVVADALERVPEAYREPLVLYYCEHRSVSAVASALGISVDAVHQRLSRGRQMVATEVAELVEHTLERRRTRRNLAASVLAALPIAVAPSHANAATAKASGGTSMLKLGIAVSVVGLGLVGAGYAVHRSSSAGTPNGSGSAPAVAGVPAAAKKTGTRMTVAQAIRAARAPSSASTPPSLHVAAAAHGPYTCASAAAHLESIASAAVLGQPSIQMTPDQVARMRTALGSAAVVMVDDNGNAVGSGATSDHSAMEQQCLAEHWSQSLIDCIATSDSLYGGTVECEGTADAPPVPGPSPAALAAVTDSSCAAVGTHITSLIVPPMPAFDPNDVPAAAVAQMNAALADIPAQLEASCVSSDWDEGMRRCLVASTAADQLSGCH